ncbi:MAG: ABC-2 transporter permease [Erysipelotrichaceae bacterium]|nr:ABC-2 transporter permease [Erysipelotrichaceae bacterium]
MKGLFRKDLEIILKSKNTLLVMVLICICMNQISSYTTIMFMTYMAAITAIGTLSYDDFDNGMPFILCLPCTKKDYVKEKFIFVFALSLFGYLFGVIASIVIMLVTKKLDLLTVFESVILLPIAYVLSCIQIPLRLKFPQEKSRMVNIICMIVVMTLSGIIYGIIEEALASPLLIALVITAIMLAALYLLYTVSIKILENKEF